MTLELIRHLVQTMPEAVSFPPLLSPISPSPALACPGPGSQTYCSGQLPYPSGC